MTIRSFTAVLLLAVTASAAGASEPPVGAAANATLTASPSAEKMADPAPVSATPDPLTPPEQPATPLQAPVPSAGEAKAIVSPPAANGTVAASPMADPAVDAIRSALARAEPGQKSSGGADQSALEAFYASDAVRPLWTTAGGVSARGEQLTAAISRAADFGLDPDAFRLPKPLSAGAGIEDRATAEIAFSRAALLYARHARGGRLDPPSLSKMIDMRPRLFEPRSVLDALAAAEHAGAYLESLHPQHPGFVALREALVRQRVAADGKLAGEIERRIAANLERWRWLPDELGAFHVWDNVPEQMTRIVHDGRVVQKERIVVGKPITPTPIFSAPMRYVIFHPTWGVPEGIKTNELAPMLRRAQANSSSGWFFSENDGAARALRRHELKVFQGGREIDPNRVNWSSVDVRQFQFTQPASNRNVLGVVKFRFPNKFDVYMHDTSERHLFTRGQRTFSHGCMRVENPLKFAETILSYDKGWSRERIAAMVAKGTTTDVTLDKTVPVHIVYFTATVDETGKLHTHPDVYGLDSRVASALAGRSVVLASAKPEPAAERQATPVTVTAKSGRAPARQPVRKTAETGSSPTGGTRPFDPFASISAN